ncbi:MAG: NADH-quinone oxidoreductase subunit B family protein [Frankiaceae bacterium]|nr:NADH-quinone oxidoreductase subunit B family protein [Frankiaceae bacterium]
MGLMRKIVRTGRVAEPAPALDAPGSASAGQGSVGPWRTGSVQLRHVDAGSCNGCELEITSAFGPVYDAERYGVRLVASPRHADALLVTGPVTHNMADPLRKAYEAMPAPKGVIAVGDCARNCGVFAGGHGVAGSVRDVLPVDLEVPGCPPEPAVLIAALRGLAGR